MASILVVDDERANRELLKAVLTYDGHVVFEAEDGERGLDVLAEQGPDLVIVDLSMPGMRGTEFVKRVRSSGDEVRETRIALYTGSDANAAMRDFMALMEIDHLIPKPAEPEEIISAVRAALT